MLRAGVGGSRLEGSAAGGVEAARAALAQLDGSADFALVFATGSHDQACVVEAVREVMPGARLAGCSAEGVIVGGRTGEVDHAVSVLAVRSDGVRFEPILVKGFTEAPTEAGRALARLCSGPGADDIVALFLMIEGLAGDATAMLAELRRALPRAIPVIGGAAADCQLFERTHQYCDGEVVSGAIAGFLLRGRADLRFGVSNGCTTVGLERTATRVRDGWLCELDGRPAWEVFREYLDGDAEDLSAEGSAYLSIGLSLAALDHGEHAEPFVVRTPVKLDKETGSLFFPGGGIREGSRIRLTRRNAELIKRSAERCAASIAEHGGGRTPAFVVQFDCAGRGRVLFGDDAAPVILEPLQRALGTTIPWIGMHTYGEIAPIGDALWFHNYSVVLCAVYEGAPG
jgi:hypothetical protein